MYPLGSATPSLYRTQPALGGNPAPTGTLFVLGEDGGYAAVAAPANRLLLGRNSNAVHVTVGSGDGKVSREQAVLRCETGAGWRLSNVGRLPIRIPDAPELLHDHEVTLPAGYTPLYITGSRRHVVELLVSRPQPAPVAVGPETDTRETALRLSDREKLVLVALYQNHLLRLDAPEPLSWPDTSDALNLVSGQRGWTARKAENVVDALRQRLTRQGCHGLTVDSAASGAIKTNLLELLARTATLIPPDLRLLGADRPRADRRTP
ncbi:hypothetical protein Vau01_121800 [Virgisporangium aurantiacum]|uniref:FHA domain-containing protein n=2 Tax=Virgisporangium aurantiacum TaxID=175570 RepID=A0A8J3ZIT0_9ACTN|nr:hypothetical protein Vau01_121800 [Virgisporangium aurantiacum]